MKNRDVPLARIGAVNGSTPFYKRAIASKSRAGFGNRFDFILVFLLFF
jgi:hypothetical protein